MKNKVIAISNRKGGTGKSTIATNLSVCFANEKRSVLLIDADLQKTSLDWKSDRPDNNNQVQVIGLPVRNLHREIEPFRNRYDVIIIDTEGRISATAKASVMVADFVIVPTLASKPDILSTQDFFREVIEEITTIKNVRGAILLNQVQAGTLICRKSEEFLKNLSYPVLKTTLRQYVIYREAIAAGLSVIEYDPNSKASQEFLNLFKEIKEVLL